MDGGQVIAILLTALLTLLVTVLAQRFLEKKVDLRYRIHSSGDLVPSNSKVPLDILYEGHPVDHLVQLQVEFINRGNIPIQKSMHEVRITWKVGSGNLIEHVVDGEKIEMANHRDDMGVEQLVAQVVLLNQGERSIMEFLIAGEANAVIEITARGVGVIGRIDTPSRLRPYAGFVGIAVAFIFALLFGTVLLPATEANIRAFGLTAIVVYAVIMVMIFAISMAMTTNYLNRRG
jgi:hypothetical protein